MKQTIDFRFATEIKEHYIYDSYGGSVLKTSCKKITNPAHIRALTEIYEGMK